MLFHTMIPAVPASFGFVPRRTNPPGHNDWLPHLPFGCDLIRTLRPKLLVELGTHFGESYFGFCQTVSEACLDCVCHAVDSWHGDAHAGFYGEEVYDDVAHYNREHYSAFSYLLRSSFDSALGSFADNSICLLHIDGLHTYEAASHDFKNWFPKVRPGGVILLHDIAARQGDFGVWRLWEELEATYDTFAFHHGWGLGVVVKPGGPEHAPALALARADEPSKLRTRDYYAACGERLRLQLRDSVACQLFSPTEAGYSEQNSSAGQFRVNDWERVRLGGSLPTPGARLRFDPADRPGLIEITELEVRDLDGRALWRLEHAADHGITIRATAVPVRSGVFTILSTGTDPQIVLPGIDAPAGPVVLEAVIRIQTEIATFGRDLGVWAQTHSLMSESAASRELLEKVRGSGAHVVLAELSRLRAELDSAGRQLEAGKRDFDVLRREFERLQREAREALSRIERMEADLNDAVEAAHDLERQRDEWSRRAARLEAECSSGQLAWERLRAEARTLEERLEATASELSRTAAERAVAEGEIAALRTALAEHRKALDRVLESWSWRLTTPLRVVGGMAKRS